MNKQLRQILLSWSNHYKSWKSINSPYLLIRYEDLISDTKNVFEKIILHIYGEVNSEKLIKAIQFSSFDELKRQEKESSFKEKPLYAKSFFRKGKTGSWKEEINDTQRAKIIKLHSDVMKELDYL